MERNEIKEGGKAKKITTKSPESGYSGRRGRVFEHVKKVFRGPSSTRVETKDGGAPVVARHLRGHPRS